MKRILLWRAGEDKSPHEHFHLIKAGNDEDNVCSITLDKVGVNPETLLGLPIGMEIVPLANRPELKGVQLPCQHRFNAMALIVHFAHNGMQCPMCRRGDASGRLSLSKTFGKEPWVESIEAKIREVVVNNNNNNHDMTMTMTSRQIASVLYIHSEEAYHHLPVHATFVLYGATTRPRSQANNRSGPAIAMRCRLDIVGHRFFSNQEITAAALFSSGSSLSLSSIPALQYGLPGSFSRLLYTQITDMNAAFLQVHIHSSYQGLEFEMAHMRRTVYPLEDGCMPIVEPSSEQISLLEASSSSSSGGDIDNHMFHFTYTPGQATLLSILALLPT